MHIRYGIHSVCAQIHGSFVGVDVLGNPSMNDPLFALSAGGFSRNPFKKGKRSTFFFAKKKKACKKEVGNLAG